MSRNPPWEAKKRAHVPVCGRDSPGEGEGLAARGGGGEGLAEHGRGGGEGEGLAARAAGPQHRLYDTHCHCSAQVFKRAGCSMIKKALTSNNCH